MSFLGDLFEASSKAVTELYNSDHDSAKAVLGAFGEAIDTVFDDPKVKKSGAELVGSVVNFVKALGSCSCPYKEQEHKCADDEMVCPIHNTEHFG